jgi:hypothetical protein
MARQSKSDKSKKDKGLHERVVVLMNSEQHAWLQTQSERTGAPLAHIVRVAVQEYRNRLTKRAKPSDTSAPF